MIPAIYVMFSTYPRCLTMNPTKAAKVETWTIYVAAHLGHGIALTTKGEKNELEKSYYHRLKAKGQYQAGPNKLGASQRHTMRV